MNGIDLSAVDSMVPDKGDRFTEESRHGEVVRSERHSVARWVVAVKRADGGEPAVDLRKWVEPKPGHEVVKLPKGSKRKGSREGTIRFTGWTREGLWLEPHEAEALAQALAEAAFAAAVMREEGEVT